MAAHAPKAPVVVGVDSSEDAMRAVRWAAHDAVLYKAPLEVVSAVPPVPEEHAGDPGVREHHDRLREQARQAVDAAVVVAAEVAPGIGTSAAVIDGPIIPALLERAGGARLVVVGARGLGAYQRSLLGSVSTALVRHAQGPIAVVPAGPPPGAERPVVVGYDDSPCSAEALTIAMGEARRRGTGLVVVHTWQRFGDYPSPAALDEEGNRLLDTALAAHEDPDEPVEVRRVVVEDRPVRRLLDESTAAQLVVVGSHGKGGFPGMTLGSTSQALVHSVECPIIVARPRAA
ncbi:universal stress protein [Nocardia vermiculata]|uniref:Universal stress protein n=1 Tax=Nocardia vermiculata TaxID=257274 RepID=A0A846Y3G0_9NOCA|nr:universal stress protein [Nocardia vermiculata]NKY52394.1 universal stress protein [Nocardia vermiculata]